MRVEIDTDVRVPMRDGARLATTVRRPVLLPGHRLRVHIASSNFPRYDRNSGTGGAIAREAEDEMVSAINRLHHGPALPSRLELPVLERAQPAEHSVRSVRAA